MSYKLKDLFLLVITFSIAIFLSVNLQSANSDAVEIPSQVSTPNTDVSVTTLTNASPIPLEKDGWRWSIYRNDFGVLCYGDSCLIANNINDFYMTPWGRCFWHNEAGWQFVATEAPIGKELKLPEELKPGDWYFIPNGYNSAIYGIDISRTYERDNWKYYVEHLVPPRDRYHHEGHLYFESYEIESGNKINDFVKTPFGRLYWHGTSKLTRYGPQGWMRTPNPRFPLGNEIVPEFDNYDFT